MFSPLPGGFDAGHHIGILLYLEDFRIANLYNEASKDISK